MTFNPDYAVPPHETLQEIILKIGIEIAAKKSGVDEKLVEKLVYGFAKMTEWDAGWYELMTGVPKSFWRNLIRQYNATKKRLAKKPPKRKKGR